MHKKLLLSILSSVIFVPLLFGSCQKEPIYSSVEISWSEPSYQSVEELETAADLVVIASPEKLEGVKGVTVSTLVTLDVREVRKGELEQPLILYQYGGSYKNEISLPPSELPLLETGKNYLLYLNRTISRNGRWYYTVTGGYQGAAAEGEDGSWYALSAANQLFAQS